MPRNKSSHIIVSLFSNSFIDNPRGTERGTSLDIPNFQEAARAPARGRIPQSPVFPPQLRSHRLLPAFENDFILAFKTVV